MEFTNPLDAWLQHLIAGKLINPTNQRPYQHLLSLPNLSTRVAADMQPGQLRVSKDRSRQPVPSTQGSLPYGSRPDTKTWGCRGRGARYPSRLRSVRGANADGVPKLRGLAPAESIPYVNGPPIFRCIEASSDEEPLANWPGCGIGGWRGLVVWLVVACLSICRPYLGPFLRGRSESVDMDESKAMLVVLSQRKRHIFRRTSLRSATGPPQNTSQPEAVNTRTATTSPSPGVLELGREVAELCWGPVGNVRTKTATGPCKLEL